MPKDLNSYTESHLQYLLELYSSRVEKANSEMVGYNSPAAAYHVITDNAFTAALVSYALAMDSNVTIDYFSKSLEACQKLLTEPANRYVNPLVIANTMHIALILGRKDEA